MLTYLARTLPVYLRARMARTPRNISTIRQWVTPERIDLNMHMNQAVYAQVMELGRTDLLVRSGAWSHWRESGVNPVVASQELTYRRELKPMARFVVDSRAVSVEGRLLRVESHMLVGDRVHAVGVARLIFVGADGVLDAEQVQDRTRAFLATPLVVHAWKVQR